MAIDLILKGDVMFNLLAVSQFVSDWFPIFQIILVSVMGLASVLLIVAILTQPASTGPGSSMLGEQSESYYSKNKGSNQEGKLKILTIVCASIIVFCAIAYFITYNFYQGAL